MSVLKDWVRNVLVGLPFPLTRNIGLDQQTIKIIRASLKNDSNCIDVGCHKGEIMDVILKAAPLGKHFGFEPIPYLCDNLQKKYQSKVSIQPYALSDNEGTSSFNLVTTNPAYSGLIKRKYDRVEEDTTIQVEVKKMDDVIPDISIDLIKIDTEGAEYGVLKGAAKIIEKYRPIILFEHGLGASEFYGTKPEMVFDFFEEMDMKIYVLKDFLLSKRPLSKNEFCKQFYDKLNYAFVGK